MERKPTSFRKLFKVWSTPEVIQHPYAAKMVMHLMIKSAFTAGPVGPDRIHLEPWQAVVSRRSLGEALNMPASTAWRTLDYLVKLGIVDRKSDREFTIATLVVPMVQEDTPSRVDHKADHKQPSVDHLKPGKVNHPPRTENIANATPPSQPPSKSGPPGNNDHGHNLKILDPSYNKGVGSKGEKNGNISGHHPTTGEPIDKDGNIIW